MEEDSSSLASSLPSVPVRARSDKQRPSRRKLRRWGNDKFIGIAAELAKAGHVSIAEEFSRGETETSQFQRANDPRNYRSIFSDISSDNNGNFGDLRRKFEEGDVAKVPSKNYSSSKSFHKNNPLNGDDMFEVLDPRLKRVLERMVTTKTSSSAAQLTSAYESYLSLLFCHGIEGETEAFGSYLARLPSVIIRDKNLIEIKFMFELDSPYGGINRLLLHAVCQFHGLCASSNTTKTMRVMNIRGNFTGESLSLIHFAKRSFEKSIDNADSKQLQHTDDLVCSVARIAIA